MTSPHLLTFILITAASISCSYTLAEDWPQHLGPNRDGSASGPPIINTDFDAEKHLLWKFNVGSGYAGPAIADNRVIVYHRLATKDTVSCLDRNTGKPLWVYDYTSTYRDDFGFDDGPRATPLIHNNRVYLHSAAGLLFCLNLQTGKPIWQVDTKKEYQSRKGFFGRVCSPVITDNILILHTGGEEHGIVGFNIDTGKQVWTATSYEAGYASPIVKQINNKTYAFCFTRWGLVILNPTNGKILAKHYWRARLHASVNAAIPVISNDKIFLSTSYGVGAIVLKWDGQTLQKIWANDNVLSNHYASSVNHQHYLFGYHGRQEQQPTFNCIDMNTGKLRWSYDKLPAGSVIRVNNNLLLLTEDGRLTIAQASPDQFKILSQNQILGFKTRALPAYSRGYFIARDSKQLKCFNLLP